jgi:hypothetical protein
MSGKSMTDIQQKRAYVSDLYPGPRWKGKVQKMPDAQVIAIYLREQDKQLEQDKSKESGDDGIPF